MAYELIANTNSCFFLTGKAGTGKTTFVKEIQKVVEKNFMVLAPTGIAAMNVGGQTMHSFFGFPFEVLGPTTQLEMSKEKRLTLQKVDTIIIDEISMVRADMIDAMDRVLRTLTHSNLPFGGKQVVFVGDLFQLPPVYKRESADEEMLHALYGNGTPYFYKSYVLKRMNLPKIELLKVYRQQDEPFLSILNRMRVGDNTQKDFDLLNERMSSDDRMGEYSVTLTAYNKIAESINNMRLDEIEAEEFCYEGVTEGNFKPQDAPVPTKLTLKVGAQVIFCRNDYLRGVVNGTIGIVSDLNDENIQVRLENGNELNVEQVEWVSMESTYNPETKKVESEVIGSFVQYPIKLAWAITIHKSQGMTFDRMHFDLTRGTFAPGQAYVAISRMRSMEGLTLSNKLRPYHIVQNTEIKAFSNSFNDMPMIDEELTFGQQFSQCFNRQDYEGAAKVCLQQMIVKIKKGDYRNAALMAKRMFDVVLDDECLMGMTNGITLLKDLNMTCNFLNAVLCLYSGRCEEAIGYADMVLDRKACLEAMFIKGRALYALGHYEDAFAVHEKMISISLEAEGKVVIDKKQYLFETRINQALGQSVIEACRHLVKLCPRYIPAYMMIREESMASGHQITMEDNESENIFVTAFNNKDITASDFEKLLVDSDKSNMSFRIFSKKIRKIETKDVSLKTDEK